MLPKLILVYKESSKKRKFRGILVVYLWCFFPLGEDFKSHVIIIINPFKWQRCMLVTSLQVKWRDKKDGEIC
jgi:hypothetical protein